jgi:hypothetical protein
MIMTMLFVTLFRGRLCAPTVGVFFHSYFGAVLGFCRHVDVKSMKDDIARAPCVPCTSLATRFLGKLALAWQMSLKMVTFVL